MTASTQMNVDQHLDALAEHGQAMAAALERAGLAAVVPTCPDWTVLDLLAHTGTVHRWATLNLIEGPDPDTGYPRDALETTPVGDPLDWFRTGHAELVATLRAAPADVVAARFLADAGTPLQFWARRQAHETAMHRADVEAVVGPIPEIDTAFALDGIAELLEGFYARRGGKLRADPGFTLRVAPRDSDVSWSVAVRPDGRTITRHGGDITHDDITHNDSASGDGTAEPEATMSGSAADLYFQLWNRPSLGDIEITGDPAVVTVWRDRARIFWS